MNTRLHLITPLEMQGPGKILLTISGRVKEITTVCVILPVCIISCFPQSPVQKRDKILCTT